VSGNDLTLTLSLENRTRNSFAISGNAKTIRICCQQQHPTECQRRRQGSLVELLNVERSWLLTQARELLGVEQTCF
jgi:hypothetical protein